MPDERILLTDNYLKREAAMAVPGAYWDRDLDHWVVENPTPRAAAVIIALFPDALAEHPELADKAALLYSGARPRNFAAELDLTLEQRAVPEGVELYGYQKTDLAYSLAVARQHGGMFIQWDRGMGKTIGSIVVAKGLEAKRVLVVTGNTNKGPVWADELAKRWPEAHVTVLPNEKAKRETTLLRWSGDRDKLWGPRVLVVHYEALALIAGDKGRGKGWDKLGEWDLMIFDEAHRLATLNPHSRKNTQLGRATMKARKHAKVALALTGTAIMNHGDDLFGELHFLFPDRYRAKYADWHDRYLDTIKVDDRPVVIGFKPERLDALREELGVFTVYRLKSEELDLPERIIEERHIELSPAQRKAYDELRDQFWTQLDGDDQPLIAQNVMTQLSLLRRVATGLPSQGEGVADSTKLDFALELVREEPDAAFVILSWYKAPLADMGRRLEAAGISYFLVDGDVPHATRAEYVRRFQEGERQVFLGTISTLGESVNLQRATRMVMLDRSWNPAQNEQAFDRIYRIGTTEPVVVTILVASGTVDELKVTPNLVSKTLLRKAVFGS